jgi:hypothetical protein
MPDSYWFKISPEKYLAIAGRIPDGTQRAEFLAICMHCLATQGGLPDDDEEIAFITAIAVERIAALRPYLNRLSKREDGQIIPSLAEETIKDTEQHNAYTSSLRGDWPVIRLQILDRDGWTCAYCGKYANTVDHIIPRKRGGSNDHSNLVAACKPCNSRKRHRLMEEIGYVFIWEVTA